MSNIYYPYRLSNGQVVCENNTLDVEMKSECSFGDWSSYAYTTTNSTICYGNNLWIFIKKASLPNQPQIYSNPDVTNSSTWTLRFNSTLASFGMLPTSSCYGNLGFLLGGYGENDINSMGMYSPDGYSWSGTTITTGTTNGVNKVFYGNEKYIATDSTNSSNGSLDRVWTSINLTTWTNTLSITGGTGSFFSGIYNNGLYVTVGTGKLYTSSDGTTWTKRSGLYGSGVEPYDVNYGNGIYLVMFGQTTNIFTSTNGITWTSGMTTGITAGVEMCKFVNCRFECITFDGTTSKQYYSTNGINWIFENIISNIPWELKTDDKTLCTVAGAALNNGGIIYRKMI